MFIDIIKTEMKKEWKQVVNHLFGKLIATGKLKKSKLENYVLQDIIYLKNYEKQWKKLATLADNKKEANYAKEQALMTIAAEMEYRNKNKVAKDTEIKTWKLTKKYIDYMDEIAKRNNYDQLFFALLSCFVGYAYLGKYMLEFKINKKYADWVKVYTSPKYFEASKEIMAMAEKRWLKLNAKEQENCKNIFRKTLILEKGFFDQVM